jgi:hypothetical protein
MFENPNPFEMSPGYKDEHGKNKSIFEQNFIFRESAQVFSHSESFKSNTDILT